MSYLIHGTKKDKTQKKEEAMEQEVRLHMSRWINSFNGQYMGGRLC